MTEKGTPNTIFSSVKIIVAKIFDIHKKVIKFEKTISIFYTDLVFYVGGELQTVTQTYRLCRFKKMMGSRN